MLGVSHLNILKNNHYNFAKLYDQAIECEISNAALEWF